MTSTLEIPADNRRAPAFIGTSEFQGTLITDFVAEQIDSRELEFSGGSVIAHNVLGIKGHSLNTIHGLQLHFSWNTGYVGATARAGAQTLSYDNRPRYLYVISSPLEVEFELERSSFRELAVQFEPSFLLKCCETEIGRAHPRVPNTGDHHSPMHRSSPKSPGRPFHNT